ncbi:DUF6482 family protein [Glaciecola sp. 1036]|uniref:DUF6482 family protein n=1 Tax=Alteromonadaceae TaxID=72275 RepID=UPI003CFD7E37
MTKFLLQRIRNKPLTIDKLEVHSFEMNIYLVKLCIDQDEGFVYGDQDKPERFFSCQQIRDVFAECTVKTAVMKHDSPYDEMIGNPDKPAQRMELPFSMAQPY